MVTLIQGDSGNPGPRLFRIIPTGVSVEEAQRQAVEWYRKRGTDVRVTSVILAPNHALGIPVYVVYVTTA